MLLALQEKKLTHLFRIFDFDHNGLIQETDITSIAENISIFRGILNDSEEDRYLIEKSQQIWQGLREYLNNPNLDTCTLGQWLDFIHDKLFHRDERIVDRYIKSMVNDVLFIFDKDKDQLISKLEFICLFISFRVEIKYANEVFIKLDLNGDKFISREELMVAFNDFFKSNEEAATGNNLFGHPGSFHFTTQETFLKDLRSQD
jgi:Ca2+-binding EF-hand superfamily protein